MEYFIKEGKKSWKLFDLARMQLSSLLMCGWEVDRRKKTILLRQHENQRFIWSSSSIENAWFCYKNSKNKSLGPWRIGNLHGLFDKLLGFPASYFNPYALTLFNLIVIIRFLLHLQIPQLWFQAHHHSPYTHNHLLIKQYMEKKSHSATLESNPY